MNAAEVTGRRRPAERVRVWEVGLGRGTGEPSGQSGSTDDAVVRRHEDRLAAEEPLEVRLSWPGRPAERVAVTMRTPGNDFELAAGLLHAEGVLESADDLHTVAYCTDHTLTAEQKYNVVTVEMSVQPRREPPARYAGLAAATSACGVCGTESIDDVLAMCTTTAPAGDAETLTPLAPAVLASLPDLLRGQQRLFDSTGGLHAAGLFEADGSPIVVREDIGRHNAVDKVVGHQLLAGHTTAAPVLAVSGRIGFEIVQKAVAAGIGVLAAVGAPSSLAIRLAEQAGLCAVGFVRGARFVIYTCPERIGV
ncbi:MAG TPA: formate dehydrogenase accessory sulfurtransferase FdhD [Nocardioidaceae bacterium]|nr:formate dehydrogenase accessory sulfurtransferase FdhD [Nocardioidaceae bacterium]